MAASRSRRKPAAGPGRRTCNRITPRGECVLRLQECIVFAVLVGVIGNSPTAVSAAGDKDGKAVRALKFAPKDASVIFAIGGKSKLTRCDDVVAVAKLLGDAGKAEAKALATQVDFDKEAIVLIRSEERRVGKEWR